MYNTIVSLKGWQKSLPPASTTEIWVTQVLAQTRHISCMLVGFASCGGCGWGLLTMHSFDSQLLMCLFSLARLWCHSHYHLSPNERKDTSMTATMLLQDSMLNPSVFRSLSEIQEKTHWSITWLRKIVKHSQTFSKAIVFLMNNRKHRSEEPHAEIMWEIHFKYNTNKHVLRFPMILFRMFISSVGLTSMSCMTNIWECKHDKASEKMHRYTTTQ